MASLELSPYPGIPYFVKTTTHRWPKCQALGTLTATMVGMEADGNQKRRYDWAGVQQYFDAGNGFTKCQQAFGFSHTAWIKAIRRGNLRIPRRVDRLSDRRRLSDWAAIQKFHDDGHSYLECRARFGFAPASWTKAVHRGEITPRSRAEPLAKILARSRSRTPIKRRLIGAGILVNECDDCGLSEWRGKPISIQIDHRNGVRDDHRIENLRMLCPNCHSQTGTFGARNIKKVDPGSSNGRTAASEAAYRGSSP